MNTLTEYVDGFVLAVKTDRMAEYQAIAQKAAAIWIEHGALDYRECVGDDMEVKDMVSFPQLAGSAPDETVVFAWIVFESREKRDEVNAKVMSDERLAGMCDPANMPFDCKRMTYGGFKTLVKP